ncbi:ADP-ribosylglycohydrolase family protein [Acidisphaera rubrifaciens]|uniref:ADP-ribosylglycohydrolase n=1 Tax=Acidisphaera rubrifaciens HS-AP3 TaxID=1231350 RepID=A0A0D6P8I4_9PROT|nr:ADP-ribosylglycohydrolase family protein [Acidisphaera rubrifaciens]GAN77982.1 ADP-ribosylglycohydrolase [Acidisphaera rubrifaciens HS-AP3]
MTETMIDRARGALVGLAVGDALGTTLEFSTRDAQPHHTEMTGGGPFRLKPGVWTDDTSMALALADSLVACGGFDPVDAMQRFLGWYRDGNYSPTGECFDIGGTTREALNRYERTGMAIAGSTDEMSAGNGSVMRLAPVAIFASGDAALCARIAAAQSRTTHGAPQAVDGCVLLADRLRRAISGEGRETLLAPQPFDGHPAVQDIAAGTWRGRARAAISASGYVVHTLEAAFWAVAGTSSFEEALIRAVNLGDDADTVGAVTGQIAGALYGMSAIPARWLAPLAWRDRLVAAADDLLSAGRAAAT